MNSKQRGYILSNDAPYSTVDYGTSVSFSFHTI